MFFSPPCRLVNEAVIRRKIYLKVSNTFYQSCFGPPSLPDSSGANQGSNPFLSALRLLPPTPSTLSTPSTSSTPPHTTAAAFTPLLISLTSSGIIDLYTLPLFHPTTPSSPSSPSKYHLPLSPTWHLYHIPSPIINPLVTSSSFALTTSPTSALCPPHQPHVLPLHSIPLSLSLNLAKFLFAFFFSRQKE